MKMAENRNSREIEKRETTERVKSWAPPTLLPTPAPQDGYSFRWIRLSTLNQADPTNLSAKLREGWEPVRAVDHPEMMLHGSDNIERYKDNIVIGGLILCKTPTELVEQRNAFYQQQTDNQTSSVDNHFLRQSDPRMPLISERKSSVSFGKGS
jgi:hypothetical protein